MTELVGWARAELETGRLHPLLVIGIWAVVFSAAPDWQPWLECFLRALREQVRVLAGKLEYEKTVLAALPAHALSIVEHVRAQGRITLREAVQLTGASRNTLKGQFRALVDRGQLRQRGEGRGAWYELG